MIVSAVLIESVSIVARLNRVRAAAAVMTSRVLARSTADLMKVEISFAVIVLAKRVAIVASEALAMMA